jgi:hypothetical protein
MRKWLLAMTVFLALLVLGGVALAQSGCPLEARVSVDKPECLGRSIIDVVTGRVTGTACGDAAVTIRYTNTCYGPDRLVGAGRTTADGAFTIPLSETLGLGQMGCHAWIDVEVECACGPLRVREYFYVPKTTVPATIPVPLAGQTTIRGQWDYCYAGATVTVADQQGHVIGTGIIQPDGSFVVYLSRPLRSGELITVSSVCGPNILRQVIGPIPIPEAGTWLLLGAGLAGVAGYVGLRWRARK